MDYLVGGWVGELVACLAHGLNDWAVGVAVIVVVVASVVVVACG